MAVTLVQALHPVPNRVNFTVPANSTFSHEPSSATAAVCTLSNSDTEADERWVLQTLLWSYDLTPAGSLTISDGTHSRKVDISAAGIMEMKFDPPLRFAADTTVTITLASGGSGVSGICNVTSAWIEKVQ